MIEKRNNNRVIFDTIISLTDNQLVWAKDISITGISFYTNQKILKGSDVNMRFQLPDDTQIELHGKVVWSTLYSIPIYICGVRFVGIPQSTQQLLENCIISKNIKLHLEAGMQGQDTDYAIEARQGITQVQ